MASIKGWQLKGLKTFQGRDWEGVQGNLYYNGKKAGWYNDSGNGGMADIDLNSKELQEQFEKSIKDYYAEHPLTGRFTDLTPDGEIFMGDLLNLMQDEKQYNKMSKKGYSHIALYKRSENDPYENVIGFKTAEGREKYLAKQGITEYRAYSSQEDFIIK